jgi:hypothetical protein
MASSRLTVFIDRILALCGSQFPRTCGTCHAVFPSFAAYVRGTAPLRAPTACEDEADAEDPIGMLSMANCACGSTLALRCSDLTGAAHRAFMAAWRDESAATGRAPMVVLAELRDMIRAAALAAAAADPAAGAVVVGCRSPSNRSGG